jgi:hypothetical protein
MHWIKPTITQNYELEKDRFRTQTKKNQLDVLTGCPEEIKKYKYNRRKHS